jgi:hypothetical protein
MTSGRLAVAVLLISSLGWPMRADQKLEAPEYITLSSGVRVRVLDVRMYAQDESPPLFVDYLTALPLRGLIGFALRRTESTGWTERGGFSGCGGSKDAPSPKH